MRSWLIGGTVVFVGAFSFAGGQTRWAVYYTDRAPLEAFADYQLLVLDSDTHPDLQPLSDRGKTLLGYLSLGEVEEHRAYFKAVQDEGLLVGENPFWKGSYFVDLRDRRWTSRVIEHLIPRILHKGFNGIFLDTLDNAPHLERQDAVRFRGMTAAAATLVRAIRYHYPHIRIMINRAYEILPEVLSQVDMVLGESIYADFNFETGGYQLVPDREYRNQVEILKSARRERPGLSIFTLDYWDPEDGRGVARIYREQRRHGFHPYVATLALDRLVKEPQP